MQNRLKVIDQLKNIFSAQKLKNRLKDRVINGALWLGAGSGTEQGLRFVRNMILARLLAPEVFGLMAIILAFKMATEAITNIGIKNAIVQHPKGMEKTYLNGAWWLALTRGTLLYGLAYIGAPWISTFYENAELVPLMRVAFLSLVLDGALSARAYVAVKEMNFKKWAIVFHGGGACGVLSAVFLALVFRNVWALVLGLAIEAAARFVLSYIVCPFRPGFIFEKENLHALFKYAKAMFGIGFLYFIFMRADIFVLGKICARSDLGMYSMAVALAQIPFQLITALMGQMALPAFSEIQKNKKKVNKLVLKLTTLIAYLCLPLLFFVALHGREILALVYGSPYAKVALPFSIIFATWFLRFLAVPIAELYYALGHPEFQRLFTAIRALVMVLLIYPAVLWFGLAGAASAALIAMIFGNIFQIFRLRRITQIDLKHYSAIFIRALAFSIPVIIISLTTRRFLSSNLFLSILPGLFGCLLAYSLAIWTSVSIRKEHTQFGAAK